VNRSQLRRLARQYATGRLEYEEYVRERGLLIDGIVCGEIPIESSEESTGNFAPARSLEQKIRATPIPLIIGACVAIAVIWALLATWPTKAPDEVVESAAMRVPGTDTSSARILVEDFLSTRDWSGEGVAEFRDRWNALTPNEQAEARAAPWFRRLSDALREEINAHKALAELDGSGLSTTTGKRLAAFAEFLGIDAQMPETQVSGERAASEAATTKTDAPMTGTQWLAAQNEDDHTLQLFAVNQLDRLELLTASHPEVRLHLLTFEGQEPRYRMLHGAFATEEQARLAYQTLPPGLRADAPVPFIRRIGELRKELRGDGRSTSAGQSGALVQTTPVYTLQLFASPNRENVDRLVDRYRTLDLRVQASGEESTRYRVLYGRFDSPEAARAASAKLPVEMLEEVGTPLLRETSEYR